MTFSAPPPGADARIDEALVTQLLRTLMPHARSLDLGERHEGRDYVVWRFAGDWAIRMPRRQLAVDRQLTEIAWLPRIAPAWPFKAPVPARVGAPTASYPWPWTVVPWVEGASVAQAGISPEGARDLGYGLRMVHAEAPPQAPLHPILSQPLSNRAARTDDKLATLLTRSQGGPWQFDSNGARRIFYAGARVPRAALAWSHLDLTPDHVITHGGAFVGIIDWGDAAAGDPATDIGQALVLLDPGHWDAMFQGYGFFDAPTFARARAEAVDFAASLALSADARRAGWGWNGLAKLGVAARVA